MASLREIRRKIKSVKSTQQITKAMKMVAAARLRRAQARILSARPFAQKMEEMMSDLLIKVGDGHSHPLFAKREGQRRALLLVTADRGLCGAFNTNPIREALKYLSKYGSENVDLFVVGRKGRDYFKRLGTEIEKEYLNIFNTLSFANAEIITTDLLNAYVPSPQPSPTSRGRGGELPRPPQAGEGGGESKGIVAVDIIYNEFKSVIQQNLTTKTLLPIAPVAGEDCRPWPDFVYEPVKEQLLEAVIQRFLRSQVFRVLLESSAAELGARLAAMDNATRNAGELLGALTMNMNRTRQAGITKEILEVVSGAEALK
jgi:F-type H+-transporting ATPase subunit gamma